MVTELYIVNSLMKTEQGKVAKYMASRASKKFTEGGDNVSVPTNTCIMSECPEYYESLVDLYNRQFGMVEGVNDIPDLLKASQAALLDSLHFGYDLDNDTYQLYTADLSWCPELAGANPKFNLDAKKLKSIMDKNKKGELYAIKFVPEYLSVTDDNNLEVTVGNIRKKIDDSEHVLLVPFLCVYALVSSIKNFLNQGGILKAVQDIDGISKVRVISVNDKMLSKYCDDPSMLGYVKPQYMPFSGVVYAPVLGAPSTTAMVTKLDMFRLSSIHSVSGLKEVQQLGVHKVKDPVLEMAMESAVIASAMLLKNNDIETLSHDWGKLPRASELLPGVEPEDITAPMLSSYLHSLKAAELKQVVKLIPGAKEMVKSRVELFSNTPEVHDGGEYVGSELYQLLKDHVCRILLKKKDHSLSTVIGTNSKKLLESIYGEGYEKVYESFSVRLRNAISQFEETGLPILDVLKEWGFDEIEPQNFFSRVQELQGNLDINVETYRSVVYEIYGKKQRKSAETSNIMVRGVDAYLVNGTAENYYRYVDPDKVIKVTVLV